MTQKAGDKPDTSREWERHGRKVTSCWILWGPTGKYLSVLFVCNKLMTSMMLDMPFMLKNWPSSLPTEAHSMCYYHHTRKVKIHFSQQDQLGETLTWEKYWWNKITSDKTIYMFIQLYNFELQVSHNKYLNHSKTMNIKLCCNSYSMHLPCAQGWWITMQAASWTMKRSVRIHQHHLTQIPESFPQIF